MKIVLLTFFLIFSVFTNAQNTPELRCGTMEYLQNQLDADPGLEIKMQLLEEKVQQWIKQNPNHNKLNKKASITIPVVVHILYKTSDQNLPDDAVRDQIAMLNRDYSGQNTNSMGMFPSSLKADTKIQFCLAQKSPNGSSTNGIERRSTTEDYFTMNDHVKHYIDGGLDAWDPGRYLNIWVCNMSGSGVLGYGQFPTTGVNETYGVVIHYRVFGKNGAVAYNNGWVTSHEVGHCLNLRHIWADDKGTCSGTDYCDDTPNQAANSKTKYTTGVVTDNCTPSSPGIMYMNFMDYTGDSTGANFSPDQAGRMQAGFGGPESVLWSLAQSDACYTPSSCEAPNSLKATISGAKATLSWMAMYGAIKYNFQFRKVGDSTWISSISNTNSISIPQVNKNTSYEFRVQTVCTGGISSYSPSKVFNTSENGIPVIGLDPYSAADLVLLPNPAKGQVSLVFFTPIIKNAEIRLIDLAGRTIIKEKLVTIVGENNYTFDLKMINEGMYFIGFFIPEYQTSFKKLMIE